MNIEKLLMMAFNKEHLGIEDAVNLLSIKNYSEDYYKLLYTADRLSRREYMGKGYIFAQIGLDYMPCSVDCKFCSLGRSSFMYDNGYEKSEQEIINISKRLGSCGISDLFLMTTADFDKQKYIDIAKKVKACLPENVRLIANIGDFDYNYAVELKRTGFHGVYHICRLNEGIDTGISVEKRISTINNIKAVGLELYYCVEPIGPEHSYEQLAVEMIRAREYKTKNMAVMRRIAVQGTPLYEKGVITAAELVKIAAVTRLITLPEESMNAHETIETSLIAGVNQLYAEYGSNPRDNIDKTENSRGFSIKYVKCLLEEYGYHI